MLIKKPLEPILNQKYLRKDETSDILDTFDAPMINVSAVNPIGQSGDKITLIGKMFDDEIEGRNIDFYNGSTYLGTGKTNKYGVGVFDYTCSGAGKKEITGKWGSLVSETYEVLDCKWFDLGTDSTNSMFGTSSTMTVNYGTEECTLTETTSGTAGVVVTNTSHYIQPNDVFEFDFLQVDGQRNFATIYVRNKANGTTLSSIPHLYEINKQLNTWIHLKCQIIDNKLTVYVDDNPTPIEKTLSNTDTDYRLYWNTVPTRDNHTIKFKNFKVYSG